MGPLAGLKVVEFAGIGPAPMCAMLLADLGATVLRVDRTAPSGLGLARPLKYDLLLRNRRSIALDLKKPEAVDLALRLIETSDVLIEGFRPGVMERLGLGPEPCQARNGRLVYGRLTGWGQTGPLAQAAAHDINYIAITGALAAIGRRGQPPTPPLNLVGDFAGGSLYLALGILGALWERERSGKGQVVDAAITDGAASLLTSLFGTRQAGLAVAERGANHADSGAFFYDTYECSDGGFVSIGAIEGKFWADLGKRLGIDLSDFPPQADRSRWPEGHRRLAEIFRTKTREEWTALLEGTDVCFAPVLDLLEAPAHPHNQARGTFVEVDGVVQPAPAPRFSRTVPAMPVPPAPVADDPIGALAGWLEAGELADWRRRLASSETVEKK